MNADSLNTDTPDTDNPNLDESEIAKFDRIANTWWDVNGEFKPLHDMNPIRANYIDEHAGVAEKKLLDVGCGGGILCEAMAQRGARVTGIDMADTPLEVARLHALESNVQIDYIKSTAENFAEKFPAEFDTVTCLEMLEHVPDPASVIQACARLVKPGGQLFFSTINRNPKAYALAILGAEYLLKLLPRGTHDYKKFIRPSELATWLREAELEIIELTGIAYNPITKKFRLDQQDVDVNYLVYARKPEPAS